eukprot:gene3708-4620_t
MKQTGISHFFNSSKPNLQPSSNTNQQQDEDIDEFFNDDEVENIVIEQEQQQQQQLQQNTNKSTMSSNNNNVSQTSPSKLNLKNMSPVKLSLSKPTLSLSQKPPPKSSSAATPIKKEQTKINSFFTVTTNNSNGGDGSKKSNLTTSKTPTTPTKKTPAKRAASTPKKRKSTSDDEEDAAEEEDDDDDVMNIDIPKTPSKKRGAFGKKDKKEVDDRYEFLENIMDANKNPIGHPDYDPRTLYIPEMYMRKFSPFERQFWEIKKMNYDTIVFFKKGKFYELYENDATIGHQLLHLKMTDRVNMKMVGVPEMSFDHWASKLIELGYKVAKVDQMETSIGMNKRQNEKGGRDKKSSVIDRQLTSILTAGTLVDESMIKDSTSTYLLAIKEDENSKQYGVCFVDVSVCEFQLTYIQDDENRTQFETLLLQTMPKEIIYEKNALSTKSMSILKRVLASVKPIMNARNSLTEYWDPQDTLTKISDVRGDEGIPNSLQEFSKDENATLALCALGACICYLNDIKIGDEIVRQGRFNRFNPLDIGNCLILDAQCLVNLEIFNNSTDGSTEGSLFKMMDRCSTSFGKRLFRKWVCRPLCKRDKILDRIEAIDHLNSDTLLMNHLTALLAKLPDLERMVSRIGAKSSKISDLISVLNHFENIQGQLQSLENTEEIPSLQLRKCITINNEKGFPDLIDIIFKIRQSFTYDKETDKITPSPGLFEEFDKCQANIKKLESELDEHLAEHKNRFRSEQIVYKHMGKEIYQIEFPISVLNRAKIDSSYTLKSDSKQVKRYHTTFIEKTLPLLLEERDTLDVLSKDVFKKIQEEFNEHQSLFIKAIECLSNLDCIMSLYRVSFQSSIEMCRPELVDSASALLQVRDMKHPCILSKSGADFIPNDLSLNDFDQLEDGTLGDVKKPPVMILTGPNMGGKSTLLRQACIVVIMAQLGCYVPASYCKLSIIDRIFTRLGANDNILAGQSTFMVELQETGNVLKYATPKSLVIMDELGRGTSTFDGYSIAYSVLKYITQKIKSLCIFATHYQSLANEPGIRDQISTFFMDCHVDDANKKVIFLYKLKEGVCPNSYGLHVGAMAGVPSVVIKLAEEKAIQFEKESTISSYIHGTIHKSDLVKKISLAIKQNDHQTLKSLWNEVVHNK